MTPSEFKSWFDGFTEIMEKTPTKAQWTRIKERVAEIDGKSVTERVFVERYWSYPHYHYHYPYIYCGGVLGGGTSWSVGTCATSGTTIPTGNSVVSLANAGYNQGGINLAQGFNSNSAMLALGKADYSATN